jgi:hypothetical protein
MMQMFHSAHYVGAEMCAHFQDGEPWQKVLGPVFIYLNSAPPGTPLSGLWEDAKRQVRLLKPINSLHFCSICSLCHLLGGELLLYKSPSSELPDFLVCTCGPFTYMRIDRHR